MLLGSSWLDLALLARIHHCNQYGSPPSPQGGSHYCKSQIHPPSRVSRFDRFGKWIWIWVFAQALKSTFVQPRCNNPIIPALRLFRGCVPPTATDYHVRNWSVQALPESTLSWACRVLAYESTTRELVVACLACA